MTPRNSDVAVLTLCGTSAAVALGACLVTPAYADGFDVTQALVTGVLPTIVEVCVAVISVFGMFVLRKIDQRTGLGIEDMARSIEAKHRDALQSAILNAAGAAVAKFGPHLVIDTTTPEGRFVVGMVQTSVPEAVAALNATGAYITAAANAKLALAPALPTPIPTAPATPSGPR